MKVRSSFIVVLVFSLSLGHSKAQSTPRPSPKKESASASAKTGLANTLSEFKRRFLNQQVVINDFPYEQDFCLQWMTYGQEWMTYGRTENIDTHLPIEYRGQTGTVVAIQLAPSSLQRTQVDSTNAFGESAREDDITDPYMDIVVKFGDGHRGTVRGYPTTIVPGNMELASSRESVRKLIESQLPSVVGRKLYAVGYTTLYKPTATIEEMSGLHRALARLSPLDVPLLEPLTITKAKYLPDVNAVIFKLRLPNGSEAIAYTASTYIDYFENSKLDFLSHIEGTLFASIPKKLTAKEVESIKKRTLFRGMSGDAVDYAIGFKDSENDWGRGGKQRIYLGGKLVVYIDSSNKVEDWQSFE